MQLLQRRLNSLSQPPLIAAHLWVTCVLPQRMLLITAWKKRLQDFAPLPTLYSSSGLSALPPSRTGAHVWRLNYSRHFFPSPPPQHLLVLPLIKKNPQSFIIADLHSNSVHIKQLLQKVGGLMNATVSSVLTQFFLIHIQLCAPSPLPHDPPPPPTRPRGQQFCFRWNASSSLSPNPRTLSINPINYSHWYAARLDQAAVCLPIATWSRGYGMSCRSSSTQRPPTSAPTSFSTNLHRHQPPTASSTAS